MICRMPCSTAQLADVQAAPADRALPIQQVGIRRYRCPLKFADGARETVLPMEVSLSIALPAVAKGAHMSRFIQLLHEPGRVVSSTGLPNWLTDISTRLQADGARAEFAFDYFRLKTAPVSGAAGWMGYPARLGARQDASQCEYWLAVEVPVTSLCPCSRAIAEVGAHNQRAHIQVRVGAADAAQLPPIAALIDRVEAQASSPLYSVLKRVDEKHVTEQAYRNPKFVEDLVRDVAASVEAELPDCQCRIEVENFESIHNHSVFAQMGVPGAFHKSPKPV